MHLRSSVLQQALRLQPVARARRMRVLVDQLGITLGHRIIDLGGTTEIWNCVEFPLDITIINLPGTSVDRTPHGKHRFTFLTGDATMMPQFPDRSFDLAFSNSVIEHVGDFSKRAAFAGEVRRLAKSYCVQTPSIHFPLEPHTGLIFWWYYPQWLKRMIFQHWEKRLPAFGEMVRTTTIIQKAELHQLFPEAKINIERIFGITKSYTAWHRY